jgi:tetratricopeptide (TPR) repeat protein
MKKYHGHWLKRLRLSRELTQSDIAGHRFTKQYISMVEKGYVKLSNNAIKYITRKLKLPKSYFDNGLFKEEKEELDILTKKTDELIKKQFFEKAEDKVLKALEISKEAKNDEYTNSFLLKLAIINMEKEDKDLEKAEDILGRVNRCYQEEKEFKNLAHSYYWTGVLYMKKQNYTDAVYMYNSSIEINSKLKRKKDLSLQARATSKIAQIYREIENYRGARQKYEEAIKLAEKSKDDYILGMAYWGYGLLLRRLGEYENAKEYYEKSLFIHERLKDEKSSLKLNNNLANVCFYLGDYDKVIKLAEKTIKLSEEKNYQEQLAYALLFRAKAKREKNLLNEAESDIKRSIKLLKKIEDKRELGVAYMTLGLIYKKKKEYELAISIFNEAIELFKYIDQPIFINSAYGEIIRFYKDIGNSNKERESTEKWIDLTKRIKF